MAIHHFRIKVKIKVEVEIKKVEGLELRVETLCCLEFKRLTFNNFQHIPYNAPDGATKGRQPIVS